MPIDPLQPDLAMSLTLDPYAPRAARYHVAQVDRPSPDLRDAVVLLTSELVTRAVQHAHASGANMELRAWMPTDVVRVELRAPRQHLELSAEDNGRDYSLLLLDELADRWSVDEAGQDACMWFEIDRHLHMAAHVEPQGRREKSLASP
ncbi:MAG: ATP-binding protein [Actinobacteria bacterium]|nr:MAG: ATP-binding protein [Actinomycetota bacterium]